MNAALDNVSPPQTTAKLHFAFIDAMRGLAALWVVLFHAYLSGNFVHLSSALPDIVVAVVFQRGSLGVPIFFSLSGFVMAHSLRKSTINPPFLKQFAIRRFARLNPPYFTSIGIALVFAAIAAIAKQEPFMPMGAPLSPHRLLAHLVYFQDLLGLEHFNDVYWTLCLEVQFYFVFVGLLWLCQTLQRSRRWNWERAVTCVFGSAALMSLIHPVGILQLADRPVLFLPHFHSFLLGIFAYWAWQHRLKPPTFYGYAGLLAVVAVVRETPFTLVAVMVAITLLEVGRAHRMSLLSHPVFQWLGKVSYSLYLTHTPVLGAMFFVGYKLTGQSLLTESIWLGAGMAVSLGIAALSWKWVEVPAIQWSRQLKQSWDKRTKESYA